MAAKKKAAKGGSKKKVAAKRTRGDDKGGESETAQSDRAGKKGKGVSSIGVNRGHIFAQRHAALRVGIGVRAELSRERRRILSRPTSDKIYRHEVCQ